MALCNLASCYRSLLFVAFLLFGTFAMPLPRSPSSSVGAYDEEAVFVPTTAIVQRHEVMLREMQQSAESFARPIHQPAIVHCKLIEKTRNVLEFCVFADCPGEQRT